jgi:hypothetical protein
MAKQAQELSIHTKKYYRVILLSIDPEKESPDSFAIKMSIRLRVPMPKVKHLLKYMPCDLKSGLTIQQANKLYHVLQELGGVAEVEQYFLTPGSVAQRSKKKYDVNTVDTKSAQSAQSAQSVKPVKPVKPGKQKVICHICGWEEPVDAEFCSICLVKFKEKVEMAKATPASEEPADNPHVKNVPVIRSSGIPALSELLNNKVFLALGITILALLVLLILK